MSSSWSCPKSITSSKRTGVSMRPSSRYTKVTFFQVRSKLAGSLAFRKKALFSEKLVECASFAIARTSSACIP